MRPTRLLTVENMLVLFLTFVFEQTAFSLILKWKDDAHVWYILCALVQVAFLFLVAQLLVSFLYNVNWSHILITMRVVSVFQIVLLVCLHYLLVYFAVAKYYLAAFKCIFFWFIYFLLWLKNLVLLKRRIEI